VGVRVRCDEVQSAPERPDPHPTLPRPKKARTGVGTAGFAPPKKAQLVPVSGKKSMNPFSLEGEG
jgi:hypothetical protein